MSESVRIERNALHFLPLGGSGEIGMNLNLYACRGKWLMVDLGITFAGDTVPGVDVLMPDPSYIEERRDDLLAIVLTHAHEDHLGAVAYLWPRLRCPVYATPFTAAVLRDKLNEAGLLGEVELIEMPLSGRFTIGPFDLEYITLTHSIPEPNALVIRTDYGTLLHTGDWKIDPEPMIGEPTDRAALEQLGNGEVLAMICDSTNALSPGRSGSEGDVRRKLIEMVGEAEAGLAVTLFASNVARLASVAVAALENGREPVLVGRSLWRYVKAARSVGYLGEEIRFLNEDEGAALEPSQALYLCTGCQGEPRAAMARIAGDSHPRIKLRQGDRVIFSSKIIPGNELAIGRMHNRLAIHGIEVLTERDHDVHVSGHPCQDELSDMYRWVRPRISIPVHGEFRHMFEHAALARSLQVPETINVVNGQVVRLAPGPAGIIGTVPTGRLAVDGSQLLRLDHETLRARRRLKDNGAVFVSLVLDGRGALLTEPRVSSHGVAAEEDTDPEHQEIADAVESAVDKLDKKERRDLEIVREAARLAVRRKVLARRGKRPVIDVLISRV
ncbi:MAG: ribonuclease J [Alphaproteobacteria bacterium]|nr:ribonuclease J [Alphaproteobacteria bacterium]